jgi:hypothetical protein
LLELIELLSTSLFLSFSTNFLRFSNFREWELGDWGMDWQVDGEEVIRGTG